MGFNMPEFIFFWDYVLPLPNVFFFELYSNSDTNYQTFMYLFEDKAITLALYVKNIITEVVKQKRLRWFGHVNIRPPENYVAKAYLEVLTNARQRCTPTRNGSSRCEKMQGTGLC